MSNFASEAGSFLDFARSYNKFGLNINKDGELEYREWAPGAKEVSIVRLIGLLMCSLVILIAGTEIVTNV